MSWEYLSPEGGYLQTILRGMDLVPELRRAARSCGWGEADCWVALNNLRGLNMVKR